MKISELYGSQQTIYSRLKSTFSFDFHVCLPGIIQKYDSDTQTVEVQPAIRERTIGQSGEVAYIKYPLLVNVPIVFPQSGNYSITFPITKGDECIVVFSDLSIDNWWLYGNVQNPIEQRRHDLSDGFAILGIKNQSKLKNINTKPQNNVLAIQNSVYGTGITIAEEDGTMTARVKRVDTETGKTYYEVVTKKFSEIIG